MLIGDVSRQSGVSARMLRHYDSMGLVSPSGRTVGGYREYAPDDVRRLFQVESLRSLGLSLRDLKRALDDPTFTPESLVADLIADTRERIDRDQELLRRLNEVEGVGPAEWTDVLRLVSLLRGLSSHDPSRRQRSALADDGLAPGNLLATALLEEDDENAAGALRWALRRSDAPAVDVLSAALQSPDSRTRHRAIAAVAELEHEKAGSLLIDALDHSDAVVRSRAALTLGARGDTRVLGELISMILAGQADVEASEALAEIARMHGVADEIAGRLTEELDRPGAAPEERLRVVQALGELPGPVAVASLRARLSDPDRPVALTALYLTRDTSQ